MPEISLSLTIEEELALNAEVCGFQGREVELDWRWSS